jgi:hypothetical protein
LNRGGAPVFGGKEEDPPNMTENAKIAFYRERFNLGLVGFERGGGKTGPRNLLDEPENGFRLSAIRDAILDLRGDLAQIDQIIRVLEWLAANPPQESS